MTEAALAIEDSNPVEDSSRCTGHCCEAFVLPVGPEELKDLYRAYKSGPRTSFTMAGEEYHQRLINDIDLIAPMVTYLGLGTIPNASIDPGRVGRIMHTYTCKHFDRTTRNCTIYDIRPQMCRDYPSYGVGTRCNYNACTWQSQRELTPEQQALRAEAQQAKQAEKLVQIGSGLRTAVKESNG